MLYKFLVVLMMDVISRDDDGCYPDHLVLEEHTRVDSDAMGHDVKTW